MMRPQSKLKQRLFRIVMLAVLIPMTMIGYMWAFQENFLFHPHKDRMNELQSLSHESEVIWLESKGQKIHSLFIRNKISNTLLLYFHGNAGTISNPWARVSDELATKLGVSIWLVDYPGFGLSEGSISDQKQLMDIAETMFDKIPEQGPFEKVIVMGRSMGTGVASQLAASRKSEIAAVILEAPYASLKQLVKQRVPWVPSMLLRYPFESQSALKDYPGPALILHGSKDDVIPVTHGRELAASRDSSLNTYLEVEGAHHDNLASYPEYWMAISWLLKKI